MDNIGQRLREERQLRGWSQRDLARETGVNTDTISGIETGQHEPRPSTLRKIAKGLGIEVRDLFAEPAVPKAEAPVPGLKGIPESLEELLDRRGIRTRHLPDENFRDTLAKLSPEDVVRVAREVHSEIEAIRPDLTRLRSQLPHNPKATRLWNEATMGIVRARFSLAEKRGQAFEPVNTDEPINTELDQALQDLLKAESALVGVG